MHMLGTVISSLIAKVTSFLDLCLAVASQTMTLYRTIIAVGIDRMTLIAQYIKSQFVALKSNIEHYLAKCIIAARLTKVEITIAQHKVGQVGQQLLTTARQTLQRVLNLLKRGR
jgi:hypothetical protein